MARIGPFGRHVDLELVRPATLSRQAELLEGNLRSVAQSRGGLQALDLRYPGMSGCQGDDVRQRRILKAVEKGLGVVRVRKVRLPSCLYRAVSMVAK